MTFAHGLLIGLVVGGMGGACVGVLILGLSVVARQSQRWQGVEYSVAGEKKL